MSNDNTHTPESVWATRMVRVLRFPLSFEVDRVLGFRV